MKRFMKFVMAIIGILSLWSCDKKINSNTSIDTIEHVVVIGFDGLSPDGLQKANTPTFDEIIAQGASTMHARAVLPSSSSTNWASMVMGAGPEQHGITSNAWEKDNFKLPAVVQDDDFLFPTIFNLIDKQKENAEIGAIYHWSGFGRLFEKDAVDFDITPENEDETAKIAGTYIEDKQPTFTFVHFDHVDHAGHQYGHGTKEYYASVEKADKLLNQVMTAIKNSKMAENTLVIISSDHGGVGKGHGGESLAEMEIPFIAWGANIKKGYKINMPVYQYDNAATVAYALGIKTPVAWIGKPVESIFEGVEIDDPYPIIEPLKSPKIQPIAHLNVPAGGLFLNATEVTIENPNQTGILRYTTDGNMPSKSSNIYDSIFKISENTVVKAAIFKNDRMASMVSEAYFRIRHNDEKAVNYQLFYLDSLKTYPDVSNVKPDASGTIFEITSQEIKEEIKPNTAVKFTSKIKIDKVDEYTFYTRSDDGSKLWINDELIVNNDGDHGVVEKNGTIELQPGKYSITVGWFNAGGSGWLDVYYKNSDRPKQLVSTNRLTN